MADASKAQKLQSAKKRFKELKDKKKNAASTKNIENTDNNRVTPVDSMTSSTHSSVTAEQTANVHENFSNTHLPDYFNSSVYENRFEQPAAFFDHLSPQSNQTQTDVYNGSPVNYFNNVHTITQPTVQVNSIEKPASFFDQLHETGVSCEDYSSLPHNFQSANENNQDSVSLDDPEIKQNDLFELHRSKEHPNIVSEKDAQELVNYFQGSTNEITDSIKKETINKTEFQSHSNMESLRQLSDQMAELIDSNSEYAVSTSITDLEKRNLELAALYEQEKIKTEQLSTLLKEVQNKNIELESQLQQKDLSADMQISQELARLKDELQSRIQTMGMLVAENTELSANLSQFELTTKQKTIECEELQARLKTSRSLVADLEREINNLKMDKSRTDHLGKEQINLFEKLNVDYKNLKEQNEELQQDLLEAREKLKHASEENVNLQHQFQDISSKLSLASIKIQQLTTGKSLQVDGQVEQLTSEKFALEKQVSSLNQMLKTITKERDESSQQYQQYAEQLNSQVYNLSTKIEQLQQENENLVLQEQNRIKHIGELERQLQNLQNEHVNYATQKSGGDSNLKNDYEATKELLVQTQIDKTALEENFTKVANEKEMLLKELAAKNESLSQLESMVEQLRGNQPDSVKLLATMESDKVAAARAVAQNKELKQQLEGMNEVFMKLNNDKVDLTEKLTVEQRSNKDLFDKLQKTEITLQTLADAIEIKDRELSHLRDNSEVLNKQVLQQEQLTDRLRHYEAQDHSSHALQSELQEAKSTVAKLTNDLNQLQIRKTEYAGIQSNGLDHSHENNESMNELKLKLQQLQKKNEELENKIKETGRSLDITDTAQSNKDTNDNDELDKEVAMKYLEDKFTRTMQDIADLQDEKQRLEHLVMQLQTETETIGEYAALYQHQRMVLKQRALEKDQQLKQLANDREQMKEKLHKLNMLIHKVVTKDNIHDSHGHPEKDFVIEQENTKNLDDYSLQMSNNKGENEETTKEIIDLLSEIETSNLVQPNHDDFHHCPWCQGQLITV